MLHQHFLFFYLKEKNEIRNTKNMNENAQDQNKANVVKTKLNKRVKQIPVLQDFLQMHAGSFLFCFVLININSVLTGTVFIGQTFLK